MSPTASSSEASIGPDNARPLRRAGEEGDPAEAFARRVAGLNSRAVLQQAIARSFAGRIALVTSFGAESAVLLHLAAQVDPAVPVIFLDTGKLFGETLRYRDALARRLGLTDLRVVEPEPAALAEADPDGVLWSRDPDRCCNVRKVLPLRRALQGFDAWITGRKRYQGGLREALPLVEAQDGRVKINPLAHWSMQDIRDHFQRHDLPRHPLQADGYSSIGCMPCTQRAGDPTDVRAGRWSGRAKTECGIHLPATAV